MLWQDAVLDRAKKGGLCAHQKQHANEHRHALQPESGRTKGHDDDLRQLDAPDQHRFLELVSQLSAERGKQKKRQYEETRGEVYQQAVVPGATTDR